MFVKSIEHNQNSNLPTSHWFPLKPGWQKQEYWFTPSTQVPSLKHGPDWHSSISGTISKIMRHVWRVKHWLLDPRAHTDRRRSPRFSNRRLTLQLLRFIVTNQIYFIFRPIRPRARGSSNQRIVIIITI